MHRKSEFTRVILQKQLGEKPSRCPPPSSSSETFLPRHQVSSRAQNMPSVPEQRGSTCQLDRKVFRCGYQGGGEVREAACPVRNVLKSMSARPAGEKRVSTRVSLSSPQLDSPAHCSSDALSGFTRVFSPPYVSTHTALLLHSSGCHSPPLQSAPPPLLLLLQCNSSRFLAAVPVRPAFPPPIALLQPCPLQLRAHTQTGSQARAPAPLRSRQNRSNDAPQWPRRDMCEEETRNYAQAHRASTQEISGYLEAAAVEEVLTSFS